MTDEKFRIHLEIHQTKNIYTQKVNGSLTVIWLNWDAKLKKDIEKKGTRKKKR